MGSARRTGAGHNLRGRSVKPRTLSRLTSVLACYAGNHVGRHAWRQPGRWPPRRQVLIQLELHRDCWIGSARVLTTCYDESMSVNVSVRLDEALAERLRLRARAAGETLSDRLRRYAEEGARRDEHPMITFRDGPTGRRAGLIGGPDVWEVAMWLDDLATEPDPVGALAEESTLRRPQI